MDEKISNRRDITSIEVQVGGKAVIAQNIIGDIHIHPESHPFRESVSPFATLPPLPYSLLERQSLTVRLVEALLGIDGSATVGIEGMAGVGKTVIALSACHDPRVRARFPDGILWITIGRVPALSYEQEVERMTGALNLNFEHHSDFSYRSMLRGKSVLLVIDDVWTLDQIEPYLLEPGRSKVLYTSRLRDIGQAVEAITLEVDILSEAESRVILGRRSSRSLQDLPEPYASMIIGECNGLILGLVMIGAALRGEDDVAWQKAVEDIRNANVKGTFNSRPSGYVYPSLNASMAASVSMLSSLEKTRYFQLAITLEDMNIDPIVLRAIWGGDKATHSLKRKLLLRSLASRAGGGSIRLHDLQLDYLRAMYSNQEELELIRLAMQRSFSIVSKSPTEFASQMAGRLLHFCSQEGVRDLLSRLELSAERPYLFPLRGSLEVAGGPCLRTLIGHQDEVRSVAISGDGERVISASNDGTLRLWLLNRNVPEKVMRGHSGNVNAVSMRNDGKSAISGGEDGTLRSWDLYTDAPSMILAQFSEPVLAVAMDLNATRVLAAVGESSLWMWNGEGQAKALIGHTSEIKSLSIDALGQRAVSCSWDDGVLLWDLNQDGSIRPVCIGQGSPMTVSISPEGNRVLYSSNMELYLVDVENGLVTRELKGFSGLPYASAISPDGTWAVTGSYDRQIRIWDLDSDRPPLLLLGHDREVCSVTIASLRGIVVSGSNDATIRVWDPKRPFFTEDVSHGRANQLEAIALAECGGYAAASYHHGELKIWDLMGNRNHRIIPTKFHYGSQVGISADGTKVLVADVGRIEHWDLAHEPNLIFEATVDGLRDVLVTKNGERLVTSKVEVYDVLTKKSWKLPTALSGIGKLAASQDGKCVVAADKSGKLALWDVEQERLLRTLQTNYTNITVLCITPDLRCVLVSCDKRIFAWRVGESDRFVGSEEMDCEISAITPSSDSRYFVTASIDMKLRVWALAGLKTVGLFSSDAPVLCCSWSGNHIAAGDRHGRFHYLEWRS